MSSLNLKVKWSCLSHSRHLSLITNSICNEQSRDVTLIEKDDFKVIEDMVLEDSQKTLQRAILQYNQQKTKRRW
jgi:hypothetical protein